MKSKSIIGYNDKYIIYENGVILNTIKNKKTSSYFDKRKRQHVNLIKKGIRKNFLVHRLIAEAFIPNPHNKPAINHIDNNPSNNKIDNLEWCTQEENMQHAARQNRLSTRRKFNYDEIWDLYKSGINKYKISKIYKANYTTIRKIVAKMESEN